MQSTQTISSDDELQSWLDEQDAIAARQEQARKQQPRRLPDTFSRMKERFRYELDLKAYGAAISA
jgi:hypothetical protein